jgi:hypothetical protein
MYCFVYIQEHRGHITSTHVVKKNIDLIQLSCNCIMLSVYMFINKGPSFSFNIDDHTNDEV